MRKISTSPRYVIDKTESDLFGVVGGGVNSEILEKMRYF